MRNCRITLFSLALVVVCAHASHLVAMQESRKTVDATGEPSAPKPFEAVQRILDEASQREQAKQLQEALKSADLALETAVQANDNVGQALAYRARANALHTLNRSEEAVAAWREAAAAWQRAGDGPGQIEALAAAALLLFRSGKQAEAQQLFAQSLAIGKNEGKRPLAASHTMTQAAEVDTFSPPLLGWAKEFLGAALSIQDRLAPRSLDVVELLNKLGVAGNNTSDYASADSFLNRALALGEEMGPHTLALAHTLDALGELEEDRENFSQSRLYYERAIALKQNLVPDSMELAFTLHRLGVTLLSQGEFSEAREFLQRSLSICEKVAPDSIEIAESLTSLSVVAAQWGDLPAARTYLTQVLSIYEKKLGPGSLEEASVRINLGAVAHDAGDYASARRYFEEALAIYARLRPNARGVSQALGNLSSVSYRQGDLSGALEFGNRALKLHEKVDPESIDVADDLTTLGKILRAEGAMAEAEQYYRRAKVIQEKRVPDSLQVAETYRELGELSHARGDSTAAVEYYRKATAISEKAAPASLALASSLYSMGELAYVQNDFASALKYHERALHIRERATGTEHPEVARSLLSMSKAYVKMGDAERAFDTALKAENIAREHLLISVSTLSERQALAYAATRTSGIDLLLTFVANGPDKSLAVRAVFDALIHSRSLVFDEMASRHRAVHGIEDPKVKHLYGQLLSARTRLATLVVRGAGDNSPEVYRKILDEARKEKEEAERALAEKSDAFRHEQARSQLGLHEATASLPPDAGLVAFARYNRHQVRRRATNDNSPEPVPSYLAFVLRPATAEPVVVPLGTANEIEGLIADWQKEMAQEAMLAVPSSRPSEAVYRKAALGLRKKIWDPVAAHLGSTQRVFVVPDGALHLVNLASLPIGASSYLIERRPLIHYLSTERDLVPFGTREVGKGLLALGAPAFDETKLFASLAPKQLASELPAEMPAVSHGFRGTRSTCGTFQSMRFEPLPASAREVRDVVALWPARGGAQSDKEFRGQQYRDSVVELRGAAASEAALKQQVQGKRVLHLATHGFFLGGRCTSALDAKATEFGDSTQAIGDNPLLLSGLAMAGANHRDAAGPDEEDGILTAEEIASLDLNGVDWAVLSACDSGVGEIKAGEGVFGLRRAFQVAGARTVIMSLWQVEDQATRQWMTALYKNRFQRGLGTAESVRAASLQLLSQRRATSQSTHPFYWAAFIATGDWR